MIQPDTLTDLSSIKTLLGPAAASDPIPATLISGVSAAIAKWCRRPLFLATNPANPLTELLNGNWAARLQLTHGPVQAPILAGCAITAGSAVITVPSTAYLFVGSCVSGPGATNLALNSYISAIGTNAVTLSNVVNNVATLAPALTTQASATLIFGPAVWLDNQAAWGTSLTAFAPQTQLFEGVDFALHRDSGDGGQESAVAWLVKLNSAFWDGRWQNTRGLLAPRRMPAQGNVKVTYWAGLQALPADLQLAATQLACFVRRNGPGGATLASESMGSYTYSVLQGSGAPEIASVRDLLAHYRRLR